MAAAVKFGKHLKELRIHLCQKSPASQGVREFIESQYVPMKKSNPRFPILIRECSGVQPVVYARYGIGLQPDVDFEKMSGPVPCRDFKQVNIGYLTFDLKITDLKYGKEASVPLSNKSSSEVLQTIASLNART